VKDLHLGERLLSQTQALRIWWNNVYDRIF